MRSRGIIIKHTNLVKVPNFHHTNFASQCFHSPVTIKWKFHMFKNVRKKNPYPLIRSIVNLSPSHKRRGKKQGRKHRGYTGPGVCITKQKKMLRNKAPTLSLNFRSTYHPFHSLLNKRAILLLLRFRFAPSFVEYIEEGGVV